MSFSDSAAAVPPASSFELMQRLRAMLIHLAVSGLVASFAAALVFLVWYPSPFSALSGGRELFILVMTVDIILGPLITFAIFNRRKPRTELRRDFAIVGVLQLLGLLYGMHTVWLVRPVFVVFEVDRFVVIRPIDLDPGALALAPPSLQSFPFLGPKVIAAKIPATQEGAAKALELGLKGRDISTQPVNWHEYADAVPSVLKRATPLAVLRRFHPEWAVQIDEGAHRAGLPVDKLAYLPIVSRQLNWIALLDTQNAKVVGYLPFGGL